jgi:hypothetical protein
MHNCERRGSGLLTFQFQITSVTDTSHAEVSLQYRKTLTNMPEPIVCTACRATQTAVGSIPRLKAVGTT